MRGYIVGLQNVSKLLKHGMEFVYLVFWWKTCKIWWV